MYGTISCTSSQVHWLATWRPHFRCVRNPHPALPDLLPYVSCRQLLQLPSNSSEQIDAMWRVLRHTAFHPPSAARPIARR